MEKNKIEMIESLEKELSTKLKAYKDFKNSEINDSYFNNLPHRAMNKLEDKDKKAFYLFNPSIGYAMLFVISFGLSFLMIDFGSESPLSEANYLFSETSIWLEDEDYLSNIIDEEFNLDYVSYINSEIDYSGINYLNDGINQLSESELDEIYKNIKNKKIL